MNPEFAESHKYGMGTVITHRVYGARRMEALCAAEEETHRLELLLSRFLPESEIARVNDAVGQYAVRVSDETLEVLTIARNFSERSCGAFDVTVGPLVSLWSVCNRTARPPDKSEIDKVLTLVDFQALSLDPVKKTAGLNKPRQSLDLGGVGKGYASDKILEVFKRHGIESAFTNFGGNVATLGTRPDGTLWRVGIRHPRKSVALIGAVDVENCSVVTSGDDQRYFVASDGKRYHHILDPRTGYPSESGLLSATVVSKSAAMADTLSTILFVEGIQNGLKVLHQFPDAGALLVGNDLTVYITNNLARMFTAADGVRSKILEN